MERPIVLIVILLISSLALMIWIAFTKWRELYQERELRNLVAWNIIPYQEFAEVSGHDFPLRSYISNAQIKFQLPQEYRISGDEEWSFADDIISEYQKDLTLAYFQRKLKKPKSKYIIDSDHYFMYALCSFLHDHQCEYKFLGHNMHGKRIEYKEYGSWGGTLFDATYSLSEFAVVYHKLYYITYLFCKASKFANPDGNFYKHEDSIKNILDSKQIQLSRY